VDRGFNLHAPFAKAIFEPRLERLHGFNATLFFLLQSDTNFLHVFFDFNVLLFGVVELLVLLKQNIALEALETRGEHRELLLGHELGIAADGGSDATGI
jgi:hypothetical protein